MEKLNSDPAKREVAEAQKGKVNKNYLLPFADHQEGLMELGFFIVDSKGLWSRFTETWQYIIAKMSVDQNSVSSAKRNVVMKLRDQTMGG